jgi:FdrA protein
MSPTVERLLVRRGAFLDSVTLMLASRHARELDGVAEAAAVAATPLNLRLLEELGFDVRAAEAGPDDVLIAIRARDERALDAAVEELELRLARRPGATAGAQAAPRSLRAAARGTDPPELAVVSVSARHAAHACASALQAGLSVFCFSDGIPVEHEARLKRYAVDRGLLLMGPECGTAILGGVGLGFANAVEGGPVGLVGASGTGLQAVSCLLDAAGVGIAQAIGVGGRDLDRRVGGVMSIRALELLAADPSTSVVGVVAKAPDPVVAESVASAAAATGKRAVLAFPGYVAPRRLDAVESVGSLEEAAGRLAELVGATPPDLLVEPRFAPRPGLVRGLFSGGTLCDEAAAIAEHAAGAAAVVRGPSAEGLIDEAAEQHLYVDFGAGPLTRGRAHPMIDLSLRSAHVERAAADDRVASLLLDVVLGHGAHPNPAAELAAAVERGLAARSSPLVTVVSLCAAERDPQGMDGQAARREASGAMVTRSNGDAARLALSAAAVGSGAA